MTSKILLRIAVAMIATVLLLVLASCGSSVGDQTKRDLENVPMTVPDKTTVYVAPNLFPNIAVTCIKGTAFVTTTRDYQQVTPVPKLDSTCPAS